MRTTEPVLQLPFDFHRTPGTGAGSARFAFELPAPAGVPAEAALAAAFGVMLYRYNAQPSVILNASRLGAEGELRWRRPFELPLDAGASCRAVTASAAEFLRGADAATGLPEKRSCGSRAAI